MSSLMIHDLPCSRNLEPGALSAIHGGLGDVSINIPINLIQTLTQIQSTNVLNNSIVGAGFSSLGLAVKPIQGGFNSASFAGLLHES